MIKKQKTRQEMDNIKQQLLLDIYRQRDKISTTSQQWLDQTQHIDSGWMLLNRIPKQVYAMIGIVALVTLNRNKQNAVTMFRNGLKWWGSLRLFKKFL